MVIRVTVMILRISGVLALILGILFWANIVTTLVGIHMLLGIIVTLSLWVLGGAIVGTKGGAGLGIAAIIWGLVVVIVGLTQQTILIGSLHWIIQVLHLLIGLAAIGFGEMIGARSRRLNALAVQSASK